MLTLPRMISNCVLTGGGGGSHLQNAQLPPRKQNFLLEIFLRCWQPAILKDRFLSQFFCRIVEFLLVADFWSADILPGKSRG